MIDFNFMKKAELTKLGRKYTIKEKNKLTGNALKFAKWAYERRRGNYEKGIVFTIEKSGNYNCFCADGEPFSYAKAIRFQNDKGEHKSNVLSAFRWAIEGSIAPLRVKGMHVDHIVPFHIILSDFMLDRSIGFGDINVHDDINSKFLHGQKCLSDENLKDEFVIYHDKVAKLRVIPARDNLVKGASEDMAIYRYRLARGETYDKL